MYNIKQAAARAGVTVPVLRAWERRYGIVRPERSGSGYRQFDDASVDRIRTMRSLVEGGWSPSAAAAAILAGEVDVTSRPPDTGPNVEPAREAIPAAELIDGFVAGARDLDPGALERILDDTFARGSFERIAADVLFPALQRLGDAWAAGTVSVAGEHLASAAVLRRLAQALEAAGGAPRTSSAPRVVVGLPPGGRHELGALAFAIAARRAGLGISYLGPDLPADDWVLAARAADAAVIGVVTARDRRAAAEVARALRADNPRVVVAFGGDAATDEPGVLHLGTELADAVAELSASLARSLR